MSKTIGVVLALKDKCSPALKKIGDSIGKNEIEMKKLNAQVQKASKQLGGQLKSACMAGAVGIGAVIASTGVLVNKTVEAGDRIDKMSQKMQMSRQTFQQLDYVFAQNGADIEIMQKGMIKLSKSMVDSSQGGKKSADMFKQLGVSVKDSGGHLRKTEDVMFDSLVALQKMPDNADRATLAYELFGKSAMELQPLINKGSKDLGMLRKQFKDLGMGMTDDAVDSAVVFGDTLDAINRSMSAFGYSIGATLLPVLQQVANQLVVNLPQIKSALLPALQGVGGVIVFIVSHLKALTVVGSAVVATMVSFNVINGVVATIKTLQLAVQAVSAAQTVWNALMIANPIGVVAVSIGVLVGGVVLLWQNWDKVTAAVGRAVGAVKNFMGIGGGVKSPAPKTPANPVKKNATGTAFSAGGSTLVGEFGPELVNMPKGASVTPANQTKNLAGKGGITINMPITIQGDMVGNNEFLAKLEQRMSAKLHTALMTV